MPRPKLTENDHEKYHKNLLNVGLGRQSTATALMSINGDLPKPDAFIFADTGWEREGTYENLELLLPLAEAAGIPFHIVRNGNIRKQQVDPEFARTELPYYCDPSRWETVEGKRELLIKYVTKAYHKQKRTTKNQAVLIELETLEEMLDAALTNFDRKVQLGLITDGYMEMSITMLGRQCTERYKIKPVNKYCRKHYGAHHTTPVGTWLGISTDEWTRMTKSRQKAFVLFYPLIDYGMTVEDCITYMVDHDYPVPVKSSCIGCPYHSNKMWSEMSDAEIEDAADFEKSVNAIIDANPKLKEKAYYANGVRLHESMIPIGQRPFLKGKDKDPMERDGVCGQAGCFL